jgi:hypothetical protein
MPAAASSSSGGGSLIRMTSLLVTDGSNIQAMQK